MLSMTPDERAMLRLMAEPKCKMELAAGEGVNPDGIGGPFFSAH